VNGAETSRFTTCCKALSKIPLLEVSNWLKGGERVQLNYSSKNPASSAGIGAAVAPTQDEEPCAEAPSRLNKHDASNLAMMLSSVVPAVNSATSRRMPFEAAVNSTINLIKSFTFSGLQKAVTADLPHEEEATIADLPHKEDEDVRVQWDGVFDFDPNIGDFELIPFDQLNEDELLNLDILVVRYQSIVFETSAERFPSPLTKLSINPTFDPSNDPSTPLINPTTNSSNDSAKQPTEPPTEQCTKPFIQSI
jgi:hypothetical protein